MDCLNLVAENLTSKEIAATLGISPHTVDQRMRVALRKLGASNRRQAARLVSDRPRDWIKPDSFPPHPLLSEPVEAVGQTAKVNQLGGLGLMPLPFATAARPTNTMSVWQRLSWIVAIAVGALLSSSIYLAGLESLARLLRR